jgi:hypothetical protein
MALASVAPAYANLIINPIFDGTITSDANATTIEATINAAIHVYEVSFTDPITVNIRFEEMGTGLGASSTYYDTISYSTYLSRLTADRTTAADAAAVLSLPAGPNNPVDGSPYMDVTTANLRALGINVNPPSGQPDGFVGLRTSIMNLDRTSINPSKYDLMGVASHEIDEVLGLGSSLNGLGNGAAAPTGAVWGMDLYRYDQTTNRSFNTTLGSQAYFSINGGVSDLARFNQTAGGDFSDWYSTGAHTPRVQDAFGTPGSTPNLGVELTALDVLGYDLESPEPATAMLVVAALALFGGLTRRRARSSG